MFALSVLHILAFSTLELCLPSLNGRELNYNHSWSNHFCSVDLHALLYVSIGVVGRCVCVCQGSWQCLHLLAASGPSWQGQAEIVWCSCTSAEETAATARQHGGHAPLTTAPGPRFHFTVEIRVDRCNCTIRLPFTASDGFWEQIKPDDVSYYLLWLTIRSIRSDWNSFSYIFWCFALKYWMCVNKSLLLI